MQISLRTGAPSAPRASGFFFFSPTPFATEAACREVLSAIARDVEANDKEFKAFLEEAGADAAVTIAPDCIDEQPAKYIAEMRGEDT